MEDGELDEEDVHQVKKETFVDEATIDQPLVSLEDAPGKEEMDVDKTYQPKVRKIYFFPIQDYHYN